MVLKGNSVIAIVLAAVLLSSSLTVVKQAYASNSISAVPSATSAPIGSWITIHVTLNYRPTNPVNIAANAPIDTLTFTLGSNPLQLGQQLQNIIATPCNIQAAVNNNQITINNNANNACNNVSQLTISFDVPLQIPSTSPGQTSINISTNPPAGTWGQNNGISPQSTSIIFTVTVPSVTLNPTAGPVGTVVTITGSGFPPNQPVSVSFDNTQLALTPQNPTTTANGAIFGVQFTVPQANQGLHTITVSAGGITASATFVVGKGLIIQNPINAQGRPGDIITIQGTNFMPQSTITLTWDGTNIPNINPSPIISDSNGNFQVTFPVPANAVPGTHTITASDQNGPISVTFTVIGATLNVSPTIALPNSIVTLTGSGFTPSKFPTQTTVQILFDNTPINTNPSPLIADSNGNFQVQITVPANTQTGLHLITAKDSSGITAQTQLQVGDISSAITQILTTLQQQQQQQNAQITQLINQLAQTIAQLTQAIQSINQQLQALQQQINQLKSQTSASAPTSPTSPSAPTPSAPSAQVKQGTLTVTRAGSFIKLTPNTPFTGTLTITSDQGVYLIVKVFDGSNWVEVSRGIVNANNPMSVDINGVTDSAGNAISISTISFAPKTITYQLIYTSG